MRVNLNAGWFWDRALNQHYLSYGVGWDWKFTETLQLTLESFGLSGAPDTPGKIRPRAQAGVRWRPNEIFSLDLIVGHNLTGELIEQGVVGVVVDLVALDVLTGLRWGPKGQVPKSHFHDLACHALTICASRANRLPSDARTAPGPANATIAGCAIKSICKA